jgi:hypothetical protein
MATNTFVELEHMPEAELLASYASIEYDLIAARQFAQFQLDQREKKATGNTQMSLLLRPWCSIRAPLLPACATA